MQGHSEPNRDGCAIKSTVDQRRVLITGGTGSIGAVLVAEFCARYSEVYALYHVNDRVALELGDRTGAVFTKVDFRQKTDLPRTDFDIVVNNAGINLAKTPIDQVTDQELLETLAVNLTTPFRIARACLPHMMANRWGRIINIGSIYSLRSCARNGSYNVSKHALTGLTKSIAADYAGLGITANEICPSAVESELMHRIASQAGDDPDEYLAKVRDSNPTGRMATPHDIAATALFLASQDASFINGSSIVLDGGQIS